jgi:hypothetical protein
MIQVLNVEHHEHVSEHSFEDVMRAFYDVTGSIEEGFGQVAKTAHSPEEFERIFKAREGSSGFMRFDVIDHGSWWAISEADKLDPISSGKAIAQFASSEDL